MTKEYCVYIMTNKSRTRYKELTGKDDIRYSMFDIRYLDSDESTSGIHATLQREKQMYVTHRTYLVPQRQSASQKSTGTHLYSIC